VKRKRVAKKKGSAYTCGTCGLVLSVDESSGSVDAAETVCCGKEMTKKK